MEDGPSKQREWDVEMGCVPRVLRYMVTCALLH